MKNNDFIKPKDQRKPVYLGLARTERVARLVESKAGPYSDFTKNQLQFFGACENFRGKICPIEVKSSTSNLHVSIDEFQKKFSARIQQRYLLHSKDIRKEQDLILLPMYMSMFL